MRRSLRTASLFLIGLTGLAALVAIYLFETRATPGVVPPVPSAPEQVAAWGRVAAWMPASWDGARARASWQAQQAHIDELSPVWYQVDASADGSVVPYSGARDAALVAEAHAGGTLVIPLINNAYGGVFDPAPVSAIIHDPARRAAHAAALVSEVLAYGYDGIDIDYESLNGQDDREAFSSFVEELAAALHAEGRLLSVTVHPKTAEPGAWPGVQAHDWSRIGAAADRVRVMTYAYHYSTGGPGPIAPLFWMEEVAAFAASVMPPERVYLGIHFYGLDWGNGPATALEWEDVAERSATYRVSSRWEGAGALGQAIAEPWFSYVAGGTEHQVWYADSRSVAARLQLVPRHRLGGIAVWRLGGEDPGNWTAIAAVFDPVASSDTAPAEPPP
jgi:spore germination protein